MRVGEVGEIAELDLQVVGPEEVARLERVPLGHVEGTPNDDKLVRVQIQGKPPAAADQPRGGPAGDGRAESR